jgi:hypothetical protein
MLKDNATSQTFTIVESFSTLLVLLGRENFAY